MRLCLNFPKNESLPVQNGRQKSEWREEVHHTNPKNKLMPKAFHKRFTIEENELRYSLILNRAIIVITMLKVPIAPFIVIDGRRCVFRQTVTLSDERHGACYEDTEFGSAWTELRA